MKVIVKKLSDEESERRDYRQILDIEINGEIVFSVWDGEPEDSNLSRDFSDCWSIPELLKKAFEAGRNKDEQFTIEEVEIDY